ncbi:hypothetical protein DSO57_1023924 [Entomophthora muscae]|uniref:Uncharacterized protein n=1 Tax=Entomophthora muscae TaxID=34485 RepID=A0ACC2U272_9FUNG|nr:hypothetical protein DSO57_1023924 [Entomophthora muscae]
MQRAPKRPAEDFDPQDLEFDEQVESNSEETILKNHFFTSALPVATQLSNPDGPPQDGLEYLLMVRNDAKKLPNVVIAKNKPLPTSAPSLPNSELKNLNYYAQFLQKDHSVSTDVEAGQERIRPDPEWQANLLVSFRKHKEDFFALRQNSAPPKGLPYLKFGEAQSYLQTVSLDGNPLQGDELAPPTPSRLASLTPPQVIHLLAYFTAVFKTPYPIDETQSQWVFGLLLRLDDLLTADDMVVLRELARSCLELRALKNANEDHILHCNTIATLVSHHFGQHDLSP